MRTKRSTIPVSRLEVIQEVSCPFCSAIAGETCRGPKGNFRVSLHAERVQNYRKRIRESQVEDAAKTEEVKPEETQYLLVSDNNPKVVYYGAGPSGMNVARKLATKIRSCGGHCTMFKSIKF